MASSTQNDNGFLSPIAGEALAANRAVKWSAANTVNYCDATEKPCGVTMAAAASGAPVLIKHVSAPGTFRVECNAAVDFGDPLYTAADGKVDDADPGSGVLWFTALETTSGSGSLVLCEFRPRV